MKRFTRIATATALGLALTLGGGVAATAAEPKAPASASIQVKAGHGAAGWHYQCKWGTAWWDPFNAFGTGQTRCGYVWLWA